nr:5'/3'-nucleotidase SurE [uncultured Clostridium sp.]
MNILITNDDGIRADGIIELAKELAKTHNGK